MPNVQDPLAYRADEHDDFYCYPGTNVLRNKLDIRDQKTLDEVELSITQLTQMEAREEFVDAPMTLKTWRELHRKLFFDIYEWAGELRVVNIQKDDFLFCHKDYIQAEADKIFTKMAAESLRDYAHAARAEKVAYYFAELNVTHPFREGNGRSQRLLFDLWLQRFGYKINWQKLDAGEHLRAVILSTSDTEQLTDNFLRTII